MANFRQIHCRIWVDPWFVSLEQDEKITWIYLFSNPSSSLCGLFELTTRQVAFDCCISPDRAKEILQKFETDGKIKYKDSVMWIVHMEHYHSQGNRNVETRKRLDVAAINDSSPVKQAYLLSHPQYTDAQIIDKAPALAANNGSKPDSGDAYAAYESNVGALTPMIADSITDAVEEYTSAWVVEAIRIATKAEKRSWSYIQAILKRWKRDGFNTEGKPQASIIDKMGPYLGQ